MVAIISVKREEANERIATIKKILDTIQVKYRPIENGVALTDRPIAFRVYVASISGVSGFTGICIICDEVSKWKDADTGANPAREVLSSVRPTMATQPNSRIFLSSSPMGRLDAHAKHFDEGETEIQSVAFAPTWIANPTVSEARTHALEPDEDKWRREYAAIPLEGDEMSLLSPALVDRAMRAGDLKREKGVTYVAAMDPAFARNAWTFVIAGKRLVDRRVKRAIIVSKEWRGSQQTPLDPSTILKEIAAVCKEFGVTELYTDQYESFSLRSIASRPDIALDVHVGSRGAVERLGRYEALATQFADGEIELPPDRTVRNDLVAIKQKLTANGFTIYLPETPDGRHSDYAPSVTLALSKCTIEPEMPPPVLTEREAEEARVTAEILAMEKASKRQGDPLVRRIGRVSR